MIAKTLPNTNIFQAVISQTLPKKTSLRQLLPKDCQWITFLRQLLPKECRTKTSLSGDVEITVVFQHHLPIDSWLPHIVMPTLSNLIIHTHVISKRKKLYLFFSIKYLNTRSCDLLRFSTKVPKCVQNHHHCQFRGFGWHTSVHDKFTYSRQHGDIKHLTVWRIVCEKMPYCVRHVYIV